MYKETINLDSYIYLIYISSGYFCLSYLYFTVGVLFPVHINHYVVFIVDNFYIGSGRTLQLN